MVNPWLDWLNDSPEILYNAMIPRGSNNFMDYYRSQFDRVYQDYLSDLGKMALSGQTPSMNFSDYLDNFNFNYNWRILSPMARGQRRSGRVVWNV